MRKFKKGQKVRVLKMPGDVVGSFPKEKIGSIVTIDNPYHIGKVYCVNSNEWECNFYEDDLEAVEEREQKFRVGDRVEVIRTGPHSEYTNHTSYKLGDRFTISKIEPYSGDYHSKKYDVDNYIFGTDGRSGMSNRDLELVSSTEERLIPVNDINELKVGDRVKQIGLISNTDNDVYATITKIDGDNIWHIHDNDSEIYKKQNNGVGPGLPFEKGIFLKVITDNSDTVMMHEDTLNDLKQKEVKQMKKPETQLEKDALAKAKKDTVTRAIDIKALDYEAEMKNFISYQKEADRNQAKADELADTLGITKEERKDLF